MYQQESQSDEFDRETLISTLKRYVEPLIIKDEALNHLKELISFEDIQLKVNYKKVSKSEVFNLTKKFAKGIKDRAIDLGRKEITSDDIEVIFAALKKSGCPLCI